MTEQEEREHCERVVRVVAPPMGRDGDPLLATGTRAMWVGLLMSERAAARADWEATSEDRWVSRYHTCRKGLEQLERKHDALREAARAEGEAKAWAIRMDHERELLEVDFNRLVDNRDALQLKYDALRETAREVVAYWSDNHDVCADDMEALRALAEAEDKL